MPRPGAAGGMGRACRGLVVAAAALAQGALAVSHARGGGCPCPGGGSLLRGFRFDAGGFSLLQSATAGEHGRDRRPDCSCIGDATTATTPRDELLGMGPVAIGSHFESCLRKRKNLEEQRDYEVAASDARVKDMEGEISKMTANFENLQNSSARNRKELQEEKAELTKEVGALQKNITAARSKYNAQFTEWYKVKEQVAAQLSTAKSCKCAAFSQVRAVPDDQRDYMYDTAQKIEACETAVIALSKEISDAQARSREATVRGAERMEGLKRSAADRQRIGAMLNAKPQIEALKKTKAALADTLESWGSKVDGYKTATEELQESLSSLKTKLSKCGCSR